MAFKKVEVNTGSDNSSELKWVNFKEQKDGDVIAVGRFMGIKPTKTRFKSAAAYFKQDDGNVVGMFAPGQLKFLLKDVANNTYVKLTYKGMDTIEQGEWEGTKAYAFDLEVDEDKKEVKAAPEVGVSTEDKPPF